MFCNYCGAPNPDIASFCNKCGKAMGRTPTSEPVQVSPIAYVTETLPVASPSTSTPAVLAVPLRQETSTAIGGTLTPTARTEFTDGLTVELRRQIEDKCFPAAIAAWIIALIAVARFNMVLAFVLAFVVAGIVFKVVKTILKDKYLRPIVHLSDEMLVNRYNEAKADRRAARTRTAISWAVIAIIFVLLAIVWVAARRR
jgi:hypothetical protein